MTVGTLGMALNFPLYEILLNKAKQRYAFDIVELAKDICRYDNQNDDKRRYFSGVYFLD